MTVNRPRPLPDLADQFRRLCEAVIDGLRAEGWGWLGAPLALLTWIRTRRMRKEAEASAQYVKALMDEFLLLLQQFREGKLPAPTPPEPSAMRERGEANSPGASPEPTPLVPRAPAPACPPQACPPQECPPQACHGASLRQQNRAAGSPAACRIFRSEESAPQRAQRCAETQPKSAAASEANAACCRARRRIDSRPPAAARPAAKTARTCKADACPFSLRYRTTKQPLFLPL